MRFASLLGLALAAIVAASCAPAAPKRVVLKPPPPVVATDPDAACREGLTSLSALWEPAPQFQKIGDACSVANPVKISALTVAWNRPSVVACGMAEVLARFEVEVVQPAAWRHLGMPVVQIHHMGTYSCRKQRGDKRLSLHATGQAIDIGSFVTADGKKVTVLKNWNDGGGGQAFLHEVARNSCQYFNVVLTPNHNQDHQNHLHLDIGPYRLCGY